MALEVGAVSSVVYGEKIGLRLTERNAHCDRV